MYQMTFRLDHWSNQYLCEILIREPFDTLLSEQHSRRTGVKINYRSIQTIPDRPRGKPSDNFKKIRPCS